MSAEIEPVRVAIVIPALNEAKVIASVVKEISVYGSVIVVNDGSTDDTENIARSAGALVVSHDKNYGYDAAVATGLANAMAGDFDFAITVDGDGQHSPACIEGLVLELCNGADLVVGIRDRFQRVSEKVFAYLAAVLWGISDPLCGMKGYRLSKLRGVGSLCSYPSIGTELAVRAVRSGWSVRQVFVMTRTRMDKSRLGGDFGANWMILRGMIIGLLWARGFNVKKND
jgi:glycosyltransferase involved in cell wall biosynthesis